MEVPRPAAVADTEVPLPEVAASVLPADLLLVAAVTVLRLPAGTEVLLPVGTAEG